MLDSMFSSQTEEDSSVLAILKNPQNSTSITKFAGPYITSIILEQNTEIEEEE